MEYPFIVSAAVVTIVVVLCVPLFTHACTRSCTHVRTQDKRQVTAPEYIDIGVTLMRQVGGSLAFTPPVLICASGVDLAAACTLWYALLCVVWNL